MGPERPHRPRLAARVGRRRRRSKGAVGLVAEGDRCAFYRLALGIGHVGHHRAGERRSPAVPTWSSPATISIVAGSPPPPGPTSPLPQATTARPTNAGRARPRQWAPSRVRERVIEPGGVGGIIKLDSRSQERDLGIPLTVPRAAGRVYRIVARHNTTVSLERGGSGCKGLCSAYLARLLSWPRYCASNRLDSFPMTGLVRRSPMEKWWKLVRRALTPMFVVRLYYFGKHGAVISRKAEVDLARFDHLGQGLRHLGVHQGEDQRPLHDGAAGARSRPDASSAPGRRV